MRNTQLSNILKRLVQIGMIVGTLAPLLAPAAEGTTIYRWVDADGKVIFSDKAPAAGKAARDLSVASEPNTTPLAEPLLRQQAVLEKSTRKSPLSAVPSRSGVSLLFVTRTCPYCRQAKSFLNEKGLPYQEYDVETSEGQRMFVAAGGDRGVPVLVQNDKRQAGFSRRSYEKFFGLGK